MSVFNHYLFLRENNEHLDQPHIISADPPLKLPQEITKIAEAFKKSKEVALAKEVDPKGGEKNITLKSRKLYIVGDAVVAHLLRRTPKKFTLVTDAHPDEVRKICRSADIQVLKSDSSTTKVSVDGKTYTIETMRDGQGLTTETGKDSQRYDTTLDCIYYDVLANKIIDHHGGLRHLKDGEVRFLGDAKESMKKNSMHKHKYAYLVNKIPNGKASDEMKELIKTMEEDEEVSPEKVREAFWSGLEDIHVDAKKYIGLYAEMGLLNKVFPGLKVNTQFPSCSTCKTRPVALAALLKDNEPRTLIGKLAKLHYTGREARDVVFLLNLKNWSKEYTPEFKMRLLQTSLTRRQVADWCKLEGLGEDLVGKLFDR